MLVFLCVLVLVYPRVVVVVVFSSFLFARWMCGGLLSLINPSVPHPDPLTISVHLISISPHYRSSSFLSLRLQVKIGDLLMNIPL